MTRLANGMTVLSDEMPHLKTAAVSVWVAAGSRFEDERQHGISHLLEHMAFKGTERRSALEIVEQIEGAGGEVNASTSLENTSYYARILQEDLPLAVDILGDILSNSVFDEGELEREQQVILQEIGSIHDIPEERVFDHAQELAFPDQPLGRTIMGTPDSVTALSRDSLNDYMASHYRGPSMILTAAGAVNHEELVRLGEEAFARFPDLPPAEAQEGRYQGGESRDLQPDLMEAQIILGFEGKSYGDKDFYTAQLLASMLGGGMSSRLFQEVRETRGLCYSIDAFHWGFADTGLFGFHTATSAEKVHDMMPVILGELERAAADLNEEELNRARAQVRAGLLMGTESPASRANQLARQKLLYGHPRSLEEMDETVADITVEDVRRVASDIFTGSAPTLSSVGPVEGLMRSEEIITRLGSKPASSGKKG